MLLLLLMLFLQFVELEDVAGTFEDEEGSNGAGDIEPAKKQQENKVIIITRHFLFLRN